MASLCSPTLYSMRRSAGLSWLWALVGVCALVLQMLTPVAARAADMGEWMVICGEDGPMLIQVSLSGDEPTQCPKCESCDACQLIVSGGGLLPVTLVSRFVPKVESADVMAESSVGINPAQFWHENRGPPLAQVRLNQDACRLSHVVTPSQGGAPWT